MSDDGRTPGLGALIASDLRALIGVKGSDPSRWTSYADVLTLPGAWAGILVRLMTWCHGHSLKPVSRLLYFANTVLFSCEIQPGATIGPGMAIAHPIGVGMARDAVVGANSRFMAMVRIGGGATDDPELDGYPTIGDDCWFLDGARVFGRVTVPDRTVIAAATTVTRSFDEPNTILVGTPARVAKRRSDP